jgi:hypothetical protein
MWTLSRDNVVTKSRLDIQSKEFMFIIMWNLSSFYVIDRLPNDTKMNSGYFKTNIHISLEHMIFHWWRLPHQKRLVIHLNNCSIHKNRASTNWLKEHGMRCIPYPATLFTWFSLQWLLFISYNQRKSRIYSDGWRGPVFWVSARNLKSIDQEELNGIFQT